MNEIFGLDFGTTNSVLAINKNKHCKVVNIDEESINKNTLRSVLYFNDERKVFVGQRAINEYLADGAHGRFMQSIKAFLPSASLDRVFVNGKSYDIEDLVAVLIRKIKEAGEKEIGFTVESVVAGRPVVFSEDPKNDRLAEQRLKTALERAGFKNIYFQYEPIAAALGYEASLKDDEEKNVIVGDFGGGTSDFTVVKLRGGNHGNEDRKKDILSVGGVYIGGDTFDSRIMWEKVAKYFGKDVRYKAVSGDSLGFPAWIVYRLCQWHLIPQLNDRKTREFLRQMERIADDKQAIRNLENLIDDNYGFMLFQSIEKAKCALSSCDSAVIDFIERDLTVKEGVTRSEFDDTISEDRAKIEGCIAETIKKSGLKDSEIDLVLLTGGSSKIPCIRKIFSDKFGNDKIVYTDEFSSVAYGLAVNGSQYI